MPETADIADTVRTRRLALGWTQQLAAERLGMSVEGYGRLERGLSVPSLATFVRICREMDVTPNALLGWAANPAEPPTDPVEAHRNRVRARLDDLDEEAVLLVERVALFAWRRRLSE